MKEEQIWADSVKEDYLKWCGNKIKVLLTPKRDNVSFDLPSKSVYTFILFQTGLCSMKHINQWWTQDLVLYRMEYHSCFHFRCCTFTNTTFIRQDHFSCHKRVNALSKRIKEIIMYCVIVLQFVNFFDVLKQRWTLLTFNDSFCCCFLQNKTAETRNSSSLANCNQ
jgi:hypothetical protein